VKIGRVSFYSSSDPYLNLALDESMLRLRDESNYYATLRFWRNPRSVVLGRGQRVEDEVDSDYCSARGITVCRRCSGGGTVYHDEGNINVSLLLPRSAQSGAGIKATCTSICRVLAESIRQCGVDGIECVGTNITHHGRKVSGSASYFTKDSFLHHSTLLHSANLDDLEKCLRRRTGAHKRGSSYMPTANLADLELERWRGALVALLGREYDAVFMEGDLTREELELAQMLRQKYSSRAWIYG
jgi:lipoate-protein ligase A